jgi:hypothetical protein
MTCRQCRDTNSGCFMFLGRCCKARETYIMARPCLAAGSSRSCSLCMVPGQASSSSMAGRRLSPFRIRGLRNVTDTCLMYHASDHVSCKLLRLQHLKTPASLAVGNWSSDQTCNVQSCRKVHPQCHSNHYSRVPCKFCVVELDPRLGHLLIVRNAGDLNSLRGGQAVSVHLQYVH